MSTYNKIVDLIKSKHGVTVKTCHIAHCKELYGLPRRNSPNRKDPNKRVYECPDRFKPLIKEAFQDLGMLN